MYEYFTRQALSFLLLFPNYNAHNCLHILPVNYFLVISLSNRSRLAAKYKTAGSQQPK